MYLVCGLPMGHFSAHSCFVGPGGLRLRVTTGKSRGDCRLVVREALKGGSFVEVGRGEVELFGVLALLGLALDSFAETVVLELESEDGLVDLVGGFCDGLDVLAVVGDFLALCMDVVVEFLHSEGEELFAVDVFILHFCDEDFRAYFFDDACEGGQVLSVEVRLSFLLQLLHLI